MKSMCTQNRYFSIDFRQTLMEREVCCGRVFKELFNVYRQFIIKNPLLASDLESLLKWASYFTTGRFNCSTLVAELLFSASSLLTFVNDTILRGAIDIDAELNKIARKLQICLSVIEYIEVFIEVAAGSIGGDFLRWSFIIIVQVIKSVIQLILLLRYKHGVIKSPLVSPLNRRRVVSALNNGKSSVKDYTNDTTHILQRSQRVLRSLDSAPPFHSRTWKLPSSLNDSKSLHVHKDKASKDLREERLLAEVLHIIKPLIHLTALIKFGQMSWIPWMTALGMDVTSLRLFGKWRETSHKEETELNRRSLMLLLYILRSPAYEKYSRKTVLHFLQLLTNNIPLGSLFIGPILEYLPQWQTIYFHTWSH